MVLTLIQSNDFESIIFSLHPTCVELFDKYEQSEVKFSKNF